MALALAPPVAAAVATRPRLAGLDIARALAFGGMLLAHFAFAGPNDTGWLRAIDDAADGRAAPLFCILLGVGAGLLVARGTPDRVLLVRGALLAALGFAIWPYVGAVYLILPHYGLMLATVPLLRRIPTRWLLPAAGLAFLVPTTVVAVMDGHGLRSGLQPANYSDVLDVQGVLGNMLWRGGYPVVGWVGFVLVGLWLARLRLGDRRVAAGLLGGGVAIAVTQPVLAWLADAVGGVGNRAQAGGVAAFFDGAAHSNRLAWYVLSSATAVAAIGACLLLASVVPHLVGRPLVALGQLALTVYLVHLFVGNQWIWPWLDAEHPPLATQMTVVALVFAAFVAAATLWRTRFPRGPVETALRTLTR